MIADWRARWKQGDFPFLFVQIAPFNGQPPEIREAQFLTLAKVKNTAMAVTTDVGNATDIHPTQKEPVGQRLALAARALAYGEKIEYSGPLYDSMTAKGGKIILNFKHAGGGLVAKDGELKGFTIAGEDKKFVPAQAKIQGKTVVVSAEGVAASESRPLWLGECSRREPLQQGRPPRLALPHGRGLSLEVIAWNLLLE